MKTIAPPAAGGRYCQFLWMSEFQATSDPVFAGSAAPVPNVDGLFEKFALMEDRAGPHQRNQMWRVDRPRQRACASITLYAMASPAAREPDPLVTFVRSRTVAKVDSIGFVVRRCTQCAAGYL